ncbi:MAG TPA: ATP-binding cassette domain-containing protein [Candidatus Tectomicrobia bacterium]|jgi:phospholipid/cholesterol/gamma-HCH transport system ATP-binding protein
MIAAAPIEVEHLTAHYGSRLILDDLSFAVQSGEILVVLGGSGSGKSTLLKHMVGLLQPTAGTVRYWGHDLGGMEEDERTLLLKRVGISFQSGGLFNSLTLADNVALPLREHSGYEEATIQALVRMKLSLVGLADAGHLLPGELSGGMRKRAGVARALALDPEILFFDEPSAGLDPITAAGLDQMILTLRRLLGLTLVVITHELESIRTVADRALMLDQGHIIFLGSLAEVAESPHPRVRQFFQRQPDVAFSPALSS